MSTNHRGAHVKEESVSKIMEKLCMCSSVIDIYISAIATCRMLCKRSSLHFYLFLTLCPYGPVFSLTDDRLLKFPTRNASYVFFCCMIVHSKFYYVFVIYPPGFQCYFIYTLHSEPNTQVHKLDVTKNYYLCLMHIFNEV